MYLPRRSWEDHQAACASVVPKAGPSTIVWDSLGTDPFEPEQAKRGEPGALRHWPGSNTKPRTRAVVAY